MTDEHHEQLLQLELAHMASLILSLRLHAQLTDKAEERATLLQGAKVLQDLRDRLAGTLATA